NFLNPQSFSCSIEVWASSSSTSSSWCCAHCLSHSPAKQAQVCTPGRYRLRLQRLLPAFNLPQAHSHFSYFWPYLLFTAVYIFVSIVDLQVNEEIAKISVNWLSLITLLLGATSKELVYKNIRFEAWDLGGQERLRASWATYYRGTHALIAVIDSTDRARISIMKEELFRLLGHEDLQHSIILIFANKQDLKDAMTLAEITDCLSLHSIKNHNWHIQACCALTGDGLYDGLGWITQRVIGKAPS
ncbi:hypothetical protein F2P56_023077, partial [Juglans regia]